MHQIAQFDIKFSKFSGGACPLTPLASVGASAASPLNNNLLCFISQLLKILVKTCHIVLTVTAVLHYNFGMYSFNASTLSISCQKKRAKSA